MVPILFPFDPHPYKEPLNKIPVYDGLLSLPGKGRLGLYHPARKSTFGISCSIRKKYPYFFFSRFKSFYDFQRKTGILLKQITMSSRLLLMHNKKRGELPRFFIALECKMLVEDLLRFLIIVTNYQDCVITRSQNQSIFGVFIIVVNRIKFKLGNAVLLSFFQ